MVSFGIFPNTKRLALIPGRSILAGHNTRMTSKSGPMSKKHQQTNPNEESTSRDSASNDEFDDDCQAIFPQRLMSILSDEKYAEAICWLPHGKAFIIRNRKLFAEMVLPKYFSRKSKYSSFTRKLNRWNFTRVSSGHELGAYYHEFFLRDKPQLAAQMFCKNARTKMAMSMPDNVADPSDPSNNANSAVTSASTNPGTMAQPSVKRQPAQTQTQAQTRRPSPAFPASILSGINAMDLNGTVKPKPNIAPQSAASGPHGPHIGVAHPAGTPGAAVSGPDLAAITAAMNSGMSTDIMCSQLFIAQQLAFAQKTQCLQGLMQKTANMGVAPPNRGTNNASNTNMASPSGNLPRCNAAGGANNSNNPTPDLDAGHFSNTNSLAACSPYAVHQQIEAQKQQFQQMVQLQQLMVMDLRQRQRQRERQAPSNNFRASAA